MIIPTHVVIFSGVGGWEVMASLTVMRPWVVTVAMAHIARRVGVTESN